MAEFKLVIGDTKTGKSYQREVKDAEANSFLGLKIRDTVKGEAIGLQGYEFMITGGSDSSGFPMRYDIEGAIRKRILAVSGVGLKAKGRGIRQRKNVCGNTIGEKIKQINLKVTKEGKTPLGGEPESPAEEAKEEAPAAEKKEAPAKEAKEEAPAAEKTE